MGVRGAAAPRTPRCIRLPLARAPLLGPASSQAGPPASRCIRLPRAPAVSACLGSTLPCLVRSRPRSDPRPCPRSDPRPCPRSELRPCPRSAMWLCTDQSCPPATNVARNSPPDISDFEIRPLELQRLWTISKNDRVKLRATFAKTVTAVTLGPLYRPRELRPGLATTNSFTKNRNHHEDLQSAAPRPHGPLQNAPPLP